MKMLIANALLLLLLHQPSRAYAHPGGTLQQRIATDVSATQFQNKIKPLRWLYEGLVRFTSTLSSLLTEGTFMAKKLNNLVSRQRNSHKQMINLLYSNTIPISGVIVGQSFDSNFGGAITLLRETRGLTQEQLARALRVSQAYISRLEAGDQEILDAMRVQFLKELCFTLKVTEERILNVAKVLAKHRVSNDKQLLRSISQELEEISDRLEDKK